MAKILLVEDNEMNLDMLSRRLAKKGYEVLTAVNGEEGLLLVLEAQPDIVLMDISLPLLDGWEVTRRIKENSNTKHIPVIALTAHAMATDREKSLEAGCDDFETKPIEYSRLLNKISLHLAKQGVI